MTIEKTVSGNRAELKISGWLNTQTSPQLEAEVNALEPDITALEMDFSEVEYVSSAGLRQIVAAYKKMKGALTLRHVSDGIRDVIRLTGLDRKIRIEP